MKSAILYGVGCPAAVVMIWAMYDGDLIAALIAAIVATACFTVGAFYEAREAKQ